MVPFPRGLPESSSPHVYVYGGGTDFDDSLPPSTLGLAFLLFLLFLFFPVFHEPNRPVPRPSQCRAT